MKNDETYRKADVLRRREYRKVLKAKSPLANENRFKGKRKEFIVRNQENKIKKIRHRRHPSHVHQRGNVVLKKL